MSKRFLYIYRIPLLISITLFVVLVAMRVEKDPISIALIMLGSFGGVFLLDLDYFLYAFVFEPAEDFSKQLQAYVKHADLTGAFTYIYFHKNDVKEKTLNSALFQIVLGAIMIFIAASDANLLVKSLALSSFTNSLYRMVEYYFEGNLSEWFWSLKISTDKNTFYVYSAVMVAALVLSISLF